MFGPQLFRRIDRIQLIGSCSSWKILVSQAGQTTETVLLHLELRMVLAPNTHAGSPPHLK